MAVQRSCITEFEAAIVGECIVNGMQGKVCEDAVAAGMLDVPYCPGTGRAPIPQCLDEQTVRAIDYCHFGDGSEPFWNAMCWGFQKDSDYWDEFISTPPCQGVLPPREPASSGRGGSVAPPPPPPDNTALYVALGVGGLLVIGGIWAATRKR